MQSSRRLRITAAHIAPRPVANESHALGGDATVCVTGAAGYVGSWITRLCLDRGYAVKACVRNVDDERKTAFLKAMPEYPDKLTLHSADMTLEGAYDDIFPGCHTVFHPAEVFMSCKCSSQLSSLVCLGPSCCAPSLPPVRLLPKPQRSSAQSPPARTRRPRSPTSPPTA